MQIVQNHIYKQVVQILDYAGIDTDNGRWQFMNYSMKFLPHDDVLVYEVRYTASGHLVDILVRNRYAPDAILHQQSLDVDHITDVQREARGGWLWEVAARLRRFMRDEVRDG